MFEALFSDPKCPDSGHLADISADTCPADMRVPDMSGSSPVHVRLSNAAVQVQALLRAVIDAGTTVLVGGPDGLVVEPPHPTLMAQLEAARDALLEALQARRAWTGEIPPAADAQTRALLAGYGVTPVLVRSEDALAVLLAELAQLPADTLIGIDIETQPQPAFRPPPYSLHIKPNGTLAKTQPQPDLSAGLDPRRADIRTVQLWWGAPEAYVVDLMYVEAAKLAPLWERLLCAHNAVFELAMLRSRLGVTPARMIDSMLGAGLVYRGESQWKLPGTRRPSLAAAMWDAAAIEVPKAGQVSDWSRPQLTADQVAYAALDGVLTRDLALRLQAQMSDTEGERGALRAAWTRANRALPAAVDIELNGLYLDKAVHAPTAADWQRQQATLTERISRELRIRPSSPTQVAQWLEAHLPAPMRGDWPRTSGRKLSTKGAHLRRLIGVVDGAELLANYKRHAALVSTFGLPLLERIHPVTGRLHTAFKLCEAKSGRASSAGPNLQNIPRASAMRAAFVAPPGRRLVGGDYSQLELRVLAHISGDLAMREAYEQGLDLHTAAGAALAGVALEDFTPGTNAEHAESRRKAKAINFGIAYGAAAGGIQAMARDSYGVRLSLEEAERFRQQWLHHYPGVARWQQRQIAQARATKRVHTLSGRPYCFDWEPHSHFRPTLAVNLPIQGTAAEIVMEAMALLHERLPACPGSARLLMQVHDEFILEVDDDEAAIAHAKDTLDACMRAGFEALLPGAPTVALCDIADGASWAEIH
jgi:DNA polymerase-1